MEALLRRNGFGDFSKAMGYISGYSVSAFLMRAIFASGLRRFPIYQQKYLTGEADTKVGRRDILKQNKTTMSALGDYASRGGGVIVMYPEGGSSERIREAQPATMKVADIIAEHSPSGFKVLPTYVNGGHSIVPRGRSVGMQRHKTFSLAKPGKGTLSIGQAVDWNSLDILATTQGETGDYLEHVIGNNCSLNHSRNRRYRILCDMAMSLVSDLAIHGKEDDGVYSHPKLKELVASL